ncbi:hypothetical protein H0266_06110 [Halobacillus locisalis]|uniref:Uncharacterized protein n=1 Tax=Halobacillus locisalis TaxID=220753 RepID=A0A838CRN5_9BACI|nr:hypothetical protein [Halobacillus locisalis]MBA2174479.1 hypothetical protein [Halobacillus locisalis]
MKKWKIIIGITAVLVLCLFHLFALMRMYPLYITSPLLFIAIYYVIASLFHRKTFRGFMK